MSLIVNRKDLDFLLYDVGGLDEVLAHSRYSDFDRSALSSILDTAETIAEEKYLSCADVLDAHEPTFDGQSVTMPGEAKAGLEAYAEAGFFAAGFPHEDGGLGLPYTFTLAANSMFVAANVSLNSYAFLTIAAANMLNTIGSEDQKALYLPPMLEGRWFGTMCLSEPQAGSSLSDIRTKAVPADGGHYLITGSKMWISGGEQEISENIVHMVLAKIPGGPPGVKGISLFIVPKYRVAEDGALGDKNNIALAGLNHKMGNRGTTNTLLNFGEGGECRGYLVGEPHKGLAYMFKMMNEARIGVGFGAATLGLAGYLYSLDYARTRPQGRAPQAKDPNSDQVMIAEHADIKRLLMAQKAAVEGAYGLLFYCSELVDREGLASTPEDAQRLKLLLEILTPIAKSWPSEFCLEANKHAIQVLGGYGYTRDYPVERFYRDNRLNHIHEGTHGIQGLDLLGRKVRMLGGAALQALVEEMSDTIAEARSYKGLKAHGDALDQAVAHLVTTTQAVIKHGDLDTQLANATIYLDAFGHVVIAWSWLRQALAAQNMLTDGTGDTAFLQGKLKACQYFFRYELPKTRMQFDLVAALDETCLSATDADFADL